MRLKKPGFTALSALLITGVLALVALKHHTLARLREQNRALGQRLGQEKISDDELELIMTVRPDRSDIENLRMTFKRAGAEWRFYGHFHHF